LIAVDASAVLAILFREPEDAALRAVLAKSGGVISPVNVWEVLVRAYVEYGDAGPEAAEDLMESLGVEVATASFEDARLALQAFKAFGKRSAARLNLGDCFAYALAQIEGEGLLFKGDDFPKTDVKPALV
jgi:ribonuclease VapC